MLPFRVYIEQQQHRPVLVAGIRRITQVRSDWSGISEDRAGTESLETTEAMSLPRDPVVAVAVEARSG